jgi:hypothetical protein
MSAGKPIDQKLGHSYVVCACIYKLSFISETSRFFNTDGGRFVCNCIAQQPGRQLGVCYCVSWPVSRGQWSISVQVYQH